MEKVLRVGVLGMGNMGKAHGAQYDENGECGDCRTVFFSADDAEAFAVKIIWTAGFMMTVSA